MLIRPTGARPRRVMAGRLVAGLLPLVLAAGTAACGLPPAAQARWVGGRAAVAPATDWLDGPGTNTGPGAGTGPGSAASPTPGRSPTKRPTPSLSEYLARVPTFGPAPQARRMRLPESGSAPWLTHITTDQPVAFVTIDDGWVKRPEALELLRRAGVPVTLFLTINAIRDNPAYFRRLQQAGAVIESHTITHTKLAGQSYDFQKREICGSTDQLADMYGRRPTLFRPPFGEKDPTTLAAAHDCGMKAVFFWKETVDQGIVRFQVGDRVQRGDILLLHFRDRFPDDFIAALKAIKSAGLIPARLEDYV